MNLTDLYEPPPELPIELVGGPRDGQVYGALLAPDGLPLAIVVVPIPDEQVSRFRHPDRDRTYPAPGANLATAIYCRDRINDTTHRWIYRPESPAQPYAC